MVAYRFVLAGFVAAASASAMPAEEELFKSLLKRQEPGTPAYDCHDNCGTAITQSRGSDPCNDSAFLSNYKNCLQCSGPDNYNIWRYYGGTLTTAGGKCGLDTEPLSGKQDDPPPANHESGSGGSGGASSSAPPTSAPAPSSTPAPEEEPEETTQGTTNGPAPTSGPAPTTGPAPTSEPEGEPTQGTTGGPAPSGSSGYSAEQPPYPTTKSGVSHSSGVPSGEPTELPPYPIYSTTKSIILSSASSGVPAPSGNGTATFTSGIPEQTTNAAPGLDMSKAAGVLGAMVFGVVYGF